MSCVETRMVKVAGLQSFEGFFVIAKAHIDLRNTFLAEAI